MRPAPELMNALTVDVEEYFHAESFAGVVQPADWPALESRVERSTQLLLEVFARHDTLATFFVLGWVAERHPGLIKAIAAAGHEIACHGYAHRLIYRQSRREFRCDVRQARGAIEDLLGLPVDGYRAPSYSITPASVWATDILIEEGFQYDSSIFPIHHDRYGMPGAERFRYTIRRAGGQLVELPPTTVSIGGLTLPLAGGGYFRLLPYPLFRWGLRRVNRQERQPAVFLVHPWEVDPDQPALPGTPLNRWRHRQNLHRTLPRLERLLADFRFGPVREVFGMVTSPTA